MILCEKCLHEEVCDQSSRQMWSAMAGETECSDFKNKTDFVEAKHGKWTNAYISGVHHYRCINCGEYIEATWTANFDYNYCPNCGAIMNEEKI